MTTTTVLNRLQALLARFARAPLRFPVPLACAVLWAGITIAREHVFGFAYRERVEQIQVFLILGLFLSLSVKLFAESRDWRIARWLPLSAGALGLLALIVLLGPRARDAYESPAFLFMGPGLILLTMVAPFLRRGAENRLIWDFNFKSWTSAAFGLLVALVLALGMMAVLGALKVLFGLNISNKYYTDVWIVCLSVIWPWQTLAGVPGGFGSEKEEYCPRWIAYLVGWLLAPMALIYLALLYAFAAKIAIQWTLPEGQVGWLVGGFAGFGLAVWHAAHPLRETGNGLVRSYARFFHPALFVPAILLAVGVGARVAEYGVTENRYALIVLTLWLAGVAVHGAVVRAPRLNIAPITFAVLLILASFGPWGATSVSVRSQLSQLETMLTAAGILIDGKIDPEQGVARPPEAKRIVSVVRYLSRGGRRGDLLAWMEGAGAELSAGEDSRTLLALMGLSEAEDWEDDGYFSYSIGDPVTLDISGFDIAHNLNFGWDGSSEAGVEGGPRYTIANDAGILSITEIGRPASKVSFDLNTFAEQLRTAPLNYNDADSARAMTLNASQNGLRARIYFETMSGQRNGDGDGNSKVTYGAGLLLIGRAK